MLCYCLFMIVCLIMLFTLRRISMIFFMRCRRTYLGHLMKRVRSRLGWMSPLVADEWGRH